MTPIKEVSFEKVYDAPIEKVWEAWTDPSKLKQWWGPDNVDIAECEVDLRVGGRFYIVMVAGEAMGPYKGTRWPMDARFTVVEPPVRHGSAVGESGRNSKLAYEAKAWTEGQEEVTDIEQVTEIMMSEENGKTKIQLKAAIHKMGVNAQNAAEGMQYGFAQQLDKLNKFLA